jgi:hypothetical protein
MAQVNQISTFGAVAMAALLSIGMQAQIGDPATLIQEKLVSQIKLTKITADHTDIVTDGDVVVLHKDGLMMCSTASSYPYSNTYNNGALAANLKNRVIDGGKSWIKGKLPFGGGSDLKDAANNGCASRKFVAGEQFRITGISVKNDGIYVSAFSNSYNDVRYYAEIKFPFPKGAAPPTDSFVKIVAEVITVQPPDSKETQGVPASQQTVPSSPETKYASTPMREIPPPDVPPPAIAVGQTRDQVLEAFGQPVRSAKLAGTTELYFYKDTKVTFVNGTVSNVAPIQDGSQTPVGKYQRSVQ